MMNLKYIVTIALLALIFLISSCTENEEDGDTIGLYDLRALSLPVELDEYNVEVEGADHDTKNRIATIGRVLFYDTDLSADGKISCASCHQQALAFSDDVDFSSGVHDNRTTRNSIALASFESFDVQYDDTNTTGSFGPGLFWDQRANNVKNQMSETIANPNEMGMSLESLPNIVQAKPYYQKLFSETDFGESTNSNISLTNIMIALETFMRSINSTGSRFDEELKKDHNIVIARDWDGFTESENRGKDLFFVNCSRCHSLTNERSSLFNRNFAVTMANNGLDLEYSDKGFGEVTGNSQDFGKFKIPSLRNIALTGPYMHDGRFNTLEEVIDFYSTGIQNHKNLHPHLRNDVFGPRKFNFSESEKTDMINFLNTLTDPILLTDRKWSDPFKK